MHHLTVDFSGIVLQNPPAMIEEELPVEPLTIQSVLLFRAEQQARRFRDLPSLGWERIISGRLEVCAVPGDHISILRGPNVERVAQLLRERL